LEFPIDGIRKYPAEYPPEGPVEGPGPAEYPAEYPVEGSDIGPGITPAEGPLEYPAEGPVEGPVGTIQATSPSKIDTAFSQNPEFVLTHKQARILLFLMSQKSRFTNRGIISRSTQVSENTVKKSIRALQQRGFIQQTRFARFGRVSGFVYSLNEDLCRYIAHIYDDLNQYPVEGPAKGPVKYPVEGPANPTSSSSYLYKGTTTTERIEQTLATHPELGYWRQKNLTPRQIEQWMEASGSTIESMIQSLCHCRFEMVDLGSEESKPVDNVFNWFYKIIERVGYYPPPKGYRSFQDKEIERHRRLLEEKERQIHELKDLSQKIRAKAQEEAFWKMMSDPESEMYKKCYSRLTDFERDLKQGKAFEAAMSRVFEEVFAS
jgi:hypothetical protein